MGADMNAKHTPGPWEVAGRDVFAVFNKDGRRQYVDIADCIPVGAGIDNARLIAAAPELLAALQAIAQSAATIAALDSCREVEVLRGIAGVCRAAIAKATGADK